MITLNLTEIENHAKFCLDEKHNRPESLSSARFIMLMSQSH
jgi:hypothetical protein